MSGFRTEWTVAGDATARTITLPLYNSGTYSCTVTWGDGSANSTITAWNDADRVHTYALDGTYQVTITGECPTWRFYDYANERPKCTDILDWGTSAAPAGPTFSNLQYAFFGCTNLKSTGVGKIQSKSTLTNVQGLFYGCTSLTEITSGIFDNCTNLTINAFAEVFQGCSNITSVPENIFKYGVSASLLGFFRTFYGCTLLNQLPNDIFRYNVAVTTSCFNGLFLNCRNLSQLPNDIFRYNILASTSSMQGVFLGCTLLNQLPNDLFRYNVAVSTSGFYGSFLDCINLENVPNLLFKYNTNCTSWLSCFQNCNKLQQNATIFYAAGEQATRFAGKTVDFTDCFYRNSNTGSQGVAPDLWNCTMTASTKTRCWGGNGNNCASLSNCADVPTTWGICPGFMIKVTVAGDATARTFTSPLPSGGTYNGTIDWGDGTAVSAITSYNDADGVHVYAADGTYLVNYYGEIPGFSFNNAGDKLKVVDILQWGRATFHGGFGYLEVGFEGCTNLVSTGLGKILSKSTLTNVRNLFRNCTGLTSITAGMFDNCTYLTTNAYNATFKGCTCITSIPSDIFKYSSGAAASGFLGTFSGCTGLTSITADIFRYNTSISTSGFDGTFYGCTGLTAIVADIFRYNTALSTGGFSTVFSGCTGLTTIVADIFRYNTSLSTSGFKQAFQNCTGLTSITANIFNYNTAVSTEGFLRTFQNCTGLTSITADIFKYNTAVTTYGFSETFSGCTGLTSITADIFKYNTAVSTNGFNKTFYGCTGITNTVTDLFRYNTAVSTSGFLGTFQNCTALASFSSNLFKYNTAVTTYGFSETFSGCTSLVTVPSDSFRYNTIVSSNGFEKTFYCCTALATVPELLFKYNIRALSFESCFEGCNKLQQNAKIFFDTSEESTRFADFGTVNFTKCFYRTSFTGILGAGVSPELWNCTYEYDNVIKTNCFSGRGNNINSLSNYPEIPREWGGNYNGGFGLKFTVSEGDKTVTLPLVDSGVFDSEVYWDDESFSTITSFDDADRSHTFTEAGTYTIYIAGALPSFSFNNSGDKLKLTEIVSLSGDDFEGFEYLQNAFYGCTNLTTVGGTIKSKAALTDLSGLFKNCTSLDLISTDLFGTNTNVTTFENCFYGCTSLATVTELLFKNNTAALNFTSCFEGCTKLQQNAKMFFDTGEESSRFAGLTLNFTRCFYRSSFNGTQGNASNLWDCSYGSVTKTNCFSGLGNSIVSLSDYEIIPVPWGGPYIGYVRLLFTVSEDDKSITLPLVNSGVFSATIIWGDGSADSTITAWNDADRTHVYSEAGTFEVQIFGALPSFSFNNSGDKLKLTGIISLSGNDFEGFEYLTGAFYGCSNLVSLNSCTIKSKSALTTVENLFRNCTSLSEIPVGFFDSCTYLTANAFKSCFYGCTSLSEIPETLFSCNVDITTSAFESCLYGCSSLSAISENIFKYNVNASTSAFKSCFYGCTSLLEIPESLFFYNIAVTTSAFESCFYRATAITEIPELLFKNNTLASTNAFKQCFRSCTNLTTINPNVFKYNVNASTDAFSTIFYECGALESVPSGIFSYNTANTSFENAFRQCNLLSSVPELLFRNNTACVSFASCFEGCTKLQQNSLIFFDTGEEATRFSGSAVDFTRCFYRSSFNGTKGTAPALWDATYAATPTKTQCWSGLGNSLVSLYNYNSIPLEWGGTYVPLEYDPANAASIFSFAFGSWEWYQAITDYNGISIEFICSVGESLDKIGYYLSAADNTFTLGIIGGADLLNCGSYTDNTWHKVKIDRLTDGVFKLYVNDILVGTSAPDFTVVNSEYITMTIGESCRIALSDPLGGHGFKVSLIS